MSYMNIWVYLVFPSVYLVLEFQYYIETKQVWTRLNILTSTKLLLITDNVSNNGLW